LQGFRRNSVVFLFIAIAVLPVLCGFIYSLLYSVGLAGLLGKGFTLEHWEKLFASGDGWRSIGYTFYLTITTTTLSMIMALAYAWYHFRQPNERSVSKLYLPLLFPPLIAGMAWYFVLSPSGLLSRWANGIGLVQSVEDFPRWVNDDFSFGIILTQFFLVFPIFTLLFLNISKKENLGELYRTALHLGGDKRYFFKNIFLPILWNRGKWVVLLYAIFLMGTYEVTLILGQTDPRTITVFIMEKLSKYNLNDIPQAHAMSVLYSTMMLLFMAILFRLKKWKVA
jgi:putative spermidine/putrescine transport system permease protein